MSAIAQGYFPLHFPINDKSSKTGCSQLKPKVWLLYWCIFHFFILVILSMLNIFQGWAILAGFIVFQFNGQQGSRARWFYLFYPAHLIILGIINYLIQSR
ncbi:hypothetical protein IQ277_34100 [Nostocales cyanobacterium LEGE 12452]|nr:hypothetical protein [Nostocales cyanobacterium LEGE 12452]